MKEKGERKKAKVEWNETLTAVSGEKIVRKCVISAAGLICEN
ncbi:MAG TPA: hypothetical protein P5348_00430 [Bacteroidales bacterium]|nr:hypothetical protein [Bacteroidales bacterium]